MTKTSLHYDVENVVEAIKIGNLSYVNRCMSKITERLYCMRCKQPITPWIDKDIENYFKGYRHTYVCPRHPEGGTTGYD